MGATAIFGPQKGVQPEDVARLDATLAPFARLAESALGRRVADKSRRGRGRRAGLSRSRCSAGRISSGAEVVSELIGLDAALADADWAITGEGRSDRQTLLAKAPFVVAQHAAARGVPVTLVSGAIDPAALAELGVTFAAASGSRTARVPRRLHRQCGPWLEERARDRPRLPGRARHTRPHCEIIAPGRTARTRGRAS
jgi:glycerate kinase